MIGFFDFIFSVTWLALFTIKNLELLFAVKRKKIMGNFLSNTDWKLSVQHWLFIRLYKNFQSLLDLKFWISVWQKIPIKWNWFDGIFPVSYLRLVLFNQVTSQDSLCRHIVFSVRIRNYTTNVTLCIGPPDSGTKVFAEKLRPSRKKGRELYAVRLFGNSILFFLH